MRTEWAGRNPTKDSLRNHIWDMLVTEKISIGDPHNEIPSFINADIAAERLSSLEIWKIAKVVKCNPDDAQIPVRLKALEDGKVLYMAVPQLVDEQCFVELNRHDLLNRGVKLEDASDWKGGLKYGHLIPFEEMQSIDIAVVGCVAVTRQGARIGKGGGFADLEFGILRYFQLIREDTSIVTTVHDKVILDDELIPLQTHDTFLTHIVTPEKVLEIEAERSQPAGILWDYVQADQLAEIPILRKLQSKRDSGTLPGKSHE